MRAEGPRGEHISGAEGLYAADRVQKALREFSLRAANHSRGVPQKVFLTVEKITRRPKKIHSLPVRTLECGSPAEADGIVSKLLGAAAVSQKAVASALKMLRNGGAIRGAALLDAATGRRLEPDRRRGVRASRMGIENDALSLLSRRLGRRGLNTPTVREALVLASKVASAKGVMAELCISDDPDYTTGYLASRALGYLRLPHVKEVGNREGGRVFFLEKGASVEGVIRYMEETPVLVTGVAGVHGTVPADFLDTV